MTGFIYDLYNDKLLKSINIISYDLPLETYQGEVGSITCEKLDADYSQYALYIEGIEKIFKIESVEVSTSQDVTTIQISDDSSIFGESTTGKGYMSSEEQYMMYSLSIFPDARVLYYNDCVINETNTIYGPSAVLFSFNGVTENAKTALRDALIADGVSGLSLFESYSADDEYIEHYEQSLTNLIRKLRQIGYESKIYRSTYRYRPLFKQVNKPAIRVDITRKEYAPIPVYFDDGHTSLMSESYANDVVTHVVVYDTSEAPHNVYFDLTTFEATGLKSRQGQGKFGGYIAAESGENWNDAGMRVFAENKWSHKVEFYSDKDFSINQPVRLMLKRGTLDTTISSVRIKSGDERKFYCCGDMAVTASDKIHSNGWSYGQRLPANPYKGQLVFM